MCPCLFFQVNLLSLKRHLSVSRLGHYPGPGGVIVLTQSTYYYSFSLMELLEKRKNFWTHSTKVLNSLLILLTLEKIKISLVFTVHIYKMRILTPTAEIYCKNERETDIMH